MDTQNNQTIALSRDSAVASIYSAIEELNPQLKEDRRLGTKEDTLLFGEGSNLDSLDLVNLIMTVEQHIMMNTGAEVLLASEAAMSRKRSPYRSIASLADYAVEVAAEEDQPVE